MLHDRRRETSPRAENPPFVAPLLCHYTARKVVNLYVNLKGGGQVHSRLPNTRRKKSHTRSTFKLFALRIVVRTSARRRSRHTPKLFAAVCCRQAVCFHGKLHASQTLWRTVRPAP